MFQEDPNTKPFFSIFPCSLQVTFDLLGDDWKNLARSISFDWLNYLNSHSQINPKIVPLLLEKVRKILETSDPDDRLMNLIPALIRLNPAAFESPAGL